MRLSLARTALRQRRVVQACSARQYATPVDYKPSAEYRPREKDPLLGDYPQLPDVTNQLRPANGWWDKQMRRNYGEVLHEEDDALNMWSPDPPVVEPSTALRQFTIAFSGIAAFGYYLYHNVPERPAIPREYPYSGLVKELGGLEENRATPESEDGKQED